MSGHRMKFVIPVGNMTKKEAEEKLRELMEEYNFDYGYWKRKERNEKYKKLFL